MFAELQQDVAAMDRELSIYKRVVQLVEPSVVHVEATPLASFRMADDIEEAGSGVVVRIGDRNYMLTNRHVIRHSDPTTSALELADGRQVRPTRVIERQGNRRGGAVRRRRRTSSPRASATATTWKSATS